MISFGPLPTLSPKQVQAALKSLAAWLPAKDPQRRKTHAGAVVHVSATGQISLTVTDGAALRRTSPSRAGIEVLAYDEEATKGGSFLPWSLVPDAPCGFRFDVDAKGGTGVYEGRARWADQITVHPAIPGIVNVERILPAHPRTLQVDAAELRSLVSKAAAQSDTGKVIVTVLGATRSGPGPAGKTLTVHGYRADPDEAEKATRHDVSSALFSAEHAPKTGERGFAASYLRLGLSMGEKTVELALDGPLAPLVIRPTPDMIARHPASAIEVAAVMPVRIA